MKKITKEERRNFNKKIKEIDNKISLLSSQIYDLQQVKMGYESFLEKGISYGLEDLFPKKKSQKSTVTYQNKFWATK